VAVQRHWWWACRGSYAEASPLLVRGSWYAREVQRAALDHGQHVGSSLRRTAEWLRSLLGRQERWCLFATPRSRAARRAALLPEREHRPALG
jgi:hypothetical protein